MLKKSSINIVVIAMFICIAANVQQAHAAADSIFEAFDSPVRWYHLYSGDDGISHLQEMPVPVNEGKAGTVVLFQRKVQEAVIAYWPDGFKYEWHNPSRPIATLSIQGTQVIQTSDGEEHRIGPGSLMLVEDVKGRGHRFHCEAPDKKKACVFMQVALDETFAVAPQAPAVPSPLGAKQSNSGPPAN